MVLGTSLLHIYPQKVHHPMRGNKLGKVNDLCDPNLNIEWVVLEKPPGAERASEAPPTKNRVKRSG